MIPHLDVAVDRGRRARPVWRKAICGPYASRHSRGFHHTPQGPSDPHYQGHPRISTLVGYTDSRAYRFFSPSGI